MYFLHSSYPSIALQNFEKIDIFKSTHTVLVSIIIDQAKIVGQDELMRVMRKSEVESEGLEHLVQVALKREGVKDENS